MAFMQYIVQHASTSIITFTVVLI